MALDLIIVRGGGDLATGAVQKLYRAGFPVFILETDNPMAVRRSVSLCEAVYEGIYQVEDVVCRLVDNTGQVETVLANGEVPLMIDHDGKCIDNMRPMAVVDAIVAKRNLGTHRGMAPITIAMGPGFEAGVDVDIVVETMRGHDMGRLIFSGSSAPNTSVPGIVAGRGRERVLHAPVAGKVSLRKHIGDIVLEGETVLHVEGEPLNAPFTGLLRGLIRDGYIAKKGWKIGDIDPRTDVDWTTISDKARCLGGGVLEALLYMKNKLGMVK